MLCYVYFATIIKISKAGLGFNELSQLLAFTHAFIMYPVSSKQREEWTLEGR